MMKNVTKNLIFLTCECDKLNRTYLIKLNHMVKTDLILFYSSLYFPITFHHMCCVPGSVLKCWSDPSLTLTDNTAAHAFTGAQVSLLWEGRSYYSWVSTIVQHEETLLQISVTDCCNPAIKYRFAPPCGLSAKIGDISDTIDLRRRSACKYIY